MYLPTLFCNTRYLVSLQGAAGRDEHRGGEGEVAHTLQRPVHQPRVQPPDLSNSICMEYFVELQTRVLTQDRNHGEGRTRAFSWLKGLTSAFTFKTLLRHYVNQPTHPS